MSDGPPWGLLALAALAGVGAYHLFSSKTVPTPQVERTEVSQPRAQPAAPSQSRRNITCSPAEEQACHRAGQQLEYCWTDGATRFAHCE
jgi:hypothetical protein